MDEYIRHKERIIEAYKQKLEALKVMYPNEWKMDHDRKTRTPEASKK